MLTHKQYNHKEVIAFLKSSPPSVISSQPPPLTCYCICAIYQIASTTDAYSPPYTSQTLLSNYAWTYMNESPYAKTDKSKPP